MNASTEYDLSPVATTPAAGRSGLRGWLGSAIPAGLVLAALAGLAWWGHHTGWNFSLHRPAPVEPDRAHRLSGLATVLRKPAVKGTVPGLGERVTIDFASAEAVERAGIDSKPVWQTAMAETVGASGEVEFDPVRVARLSARASGGAWRVFKAVGDRVKTGDVLALITADAVGKLKADFLQALVQARLRRKTVANLRSAAVVPKQQRQEAEAALQEAEVRLLGAEQALVNLGLPVQGSDYQTLSVDEAVARLRHVGVPTAGTGLAAETVPANLLPVRAALDGVVLAADVVEGEMVEAGKVLFTVVDPRKVWVTLHVGPEDGRRVAIGQVVQFRPDGVAEEFTGRVIGVGTAANETTRTLPVRAAFANDLGRLRASALGRGRIVLDEEADALVVPHEAVQVYRGVPVVFVRDRNFLKPEGPKAFHVRAVRTGAKDAQYTRIVAGLSADEVVATKGSGILLGELRRTSGDPTNGRRERVKE